MNKQLPTLSILLAGIALSSSAFSASYFGLGYGYGQFNTTKTASNVIVTNSNQAGTLFAGHLWECKKLNYGLEVAGNSFNQKKWTIVGDIFTLKSKTFEVAGVVILPKENYFLQAKAGGAYVQQTTKLNVTDPTTSLPLTDMGEKNNSYRPLVGVAVGIDVDKHFKVDVSYTHLFAQKSSAPVSTAGNIASTADFNKIASLDSVLLRFGYII